MPPTIEEAPVTFSCAQTAAAHAAPPSPIRIRADTREGECQPWRRSR